MSTEGIGLSRLRGLVNYMEGLPSAMGGIPEGDPGWLEGEFKVHEDGDTVWATLYFDHEIEEWSAIFPSEGEHA